MALKHKEAVAAIALHAAMVARFIKVLEDAPFRISSVIGNPEYARVSIEGEEATIRWLEAVDDYDGGCSIENNNYSIPLELLFISDDELAAWKVEQRAIYDREQKERQAAAARAAEAKERAALAALKAKYEPSSIF